MRVEPITFAYVDTHIDLAGAQGLTATPGDLRIWQMRGSALVATATSVHGTFGTFVEVQATPTETGSTPPIILRWTRDSDQFNTVISSAPIFKSSPMLTVYATTLGPIPDYEFKLQPS